jgi:hypothetical protein
MRQAAACVRAASVASRPAGSVLGAQRVCARAARRAPRAEPERTRHTLQRAAADDEEGTARSPRARRRARSCGAVRAARARRRRAAGRAPLSTTYRSGARRAESGRGSRARGETGTV